jgi:hypothetical protein
MSELEGLCGNVRQIVRMGSLEEIGPEFSVNIKQYFVNA